MNFRWGKYPGNCKNADVGISETPSPPMLANVGNLDPPPSPPRNGRRPLWTAPYVVCCKKIPLQQAIDTETEKTVFMFSRGCVTLSNKQTYLKFRAYNDLVTILKHLISYSNLSNTTSCFLPFTVNIVLVASDKFAS